MGNPNAILINPPDGIDLGDGGPYIGWDTATYHNVLRVGPRNSPVPASQTIAFQGATGTNVAGVASGLQAPLGTGTGAAGSLVFDVGTPQTTGATQHVAARALTLFDAGASGTSKPLARLDAEAPAAGTMTATAAATIKKVVHRYDWTNAMVVALGAVTTGDILVCTLPANTVVTNVYVIIDSPDTSPNALTIAVGRTSANYVDYIVASDAKASANTVYGDASGERGTNLNGYDLPSVTATTAVYAHFIKTTSNLSTVTGSSGHIYIETMKLP